MWTLLFVVFATGSPAVLHAAPIQGDSSRCSFAGVFHVKGSSRYSLSFQKALELCQSLGYKLATQEQVTEAYKKGLRTCRYGWIDGQNVMFLPHNNGPNCDSGSTEVTFRPEAAEYLSDVYCFKPSDSSLNCEDTVKSEGSVNGNTATENGKPHEDILKEVKTEGFLVDLEEILGRVKRETFSKTVLPDVDAKPSSVPTLEKPSMTKNVDTTGTTSKPHLWKSSSSVTPSVLFFDTEGSGSGLFTAIIQNNPDVVISNNSRMMFNPIEQPSVPIRKAEGPSTWMIIFAFCVVVGAIVCILAAIATKDKWYGPRDSRNITAAEHNKDYSKSETLPLSEKEQEIVALMSIASLKDGKMEDITATCLDEREKEYLM